MAPRMSARVRAIDRASSPQVDRAIDRLRHPSRHDRLLGLNERRNTSAEVALLHEAAAAQQRRLTVSGATAKSDARALRIVFSDRRRKLEAGLEEGEVNRRRSRDYSAAQLHVRRSQMAARRGCARDQVAPTLPRLAARAAAGEPPAEGVGIGERRTSDPPVSPIAPSPVSPCGSIFVHSRSSAPPSLAQAVVQAPPTPPMPTPTRRRIVSFGT